MAASTPRSSTQLMRGRESGGAAASIKENESPSSPTSPTQSRHQRFVLPDPVALSYLEEDKSTILLDRSRTLGGYQIYIVEQWACSRSHPTFCITSYTGDSSDTIQVGILSVSADESSWSPRLRVYFKAVAQYHAKRRETPLGTLLVTNLSGFPSSLTIVPIPDGDLRKYREDFVVNENLKRLGCSGRVGLTLARPTGATQAKFHQLYMTSDRIDLYDSVIELVKLCQVALLFFHKLELEYCDGLLCDVTEKAISDWWASIGMDLYNVEPSDGVLGPTTVAALLGTLMGARNRLNAYGAPVGKDVFDIEATKQAILDFQRSQRLPKTRRLDRHTLDRLHRATAKQASGDSWIVPRAVKSTVAELSGKGGEMVMEMVGRDKANIAEIETVDIERFAQLVKGERARWLWQGKPRKRTTRDMFSDPQAPQTTSPDYSKPSSTISRQLSRVTTEQPPGPKLTLTTSLERSSTRSRRPSEEDDALLKKTVLNRAKGRIRDAVGKKSPQDAPLKEGSPLFSNEDKSEESFGSVDTGDPSSPWASKRLSNDKIDDVQQGSTENLSPPRFAKTMTDTPIEAQSADLLSASRDQPHLGDPIDFEAQALAVGETSGTVTAGQSDVGSNAYDTDAEEIGPKTTASSLDPERVLRHRSSFSKHVADTLEMRNDNFWPRHLSFSVAEDAVLPRNGLLDAPSADAAGPDAPASLAAQLRSLHCHTAKNKHLRALLAHLSAEAHWTKNQLEAVEALSALASQDSAQLNSIYHPRKDAYAALAEASRETLAEQRARLHDALKDVETAGAKLEYEISGLKGKVEDVEDSVAEFERGVAFAEGRVGELVRSSGGAASGEGWSAWLSRTLFGVERRQADKSAKE